MLRKAECGRGRRSSSGGLLGHRASAPPLHQGAPGHGRPRFPGYGVRWGAADLAQVLVSIPVTKKMSSSRKLSGSNADRAAAIMTEPGAKEAYVYAMGEEPWLGRGSCPVAAEHTCFWQRAAVRFGVPDFCGRLQAEVPASSARRPSGRTGGVEGTRGNLIARHRTDRPPMAGSPSRRVVLHVSGDQVEQGVSPVPVPVLGAQGPVGGPEAGQGGRFAVHHVVDRWRGPGIR